MIVKVHMLAFKDKGIVRDVEIHDNYKGHLGALEQVFKMGQNEFQQRDCPSVSMGDVIEFEIGRNKYWQVTSSGFKPLTQEEFDDMPGYFTQSDKFMELFA